MASRVRRPESIPGRPGTKFSRPFQGFTRDFSREPHILTRMMTLLRRYILWCLVETRERKALRRFQDRFFAPPTSPGKRSTLAPGRSTTVMQAYGRPCECRLQRGAQETPAAAGVLLSVGMAVVCSPHVSDAVELRSGMFREG